MIGHDDAGLTCPGAMATSDVPRNAAAAAASRTGTQPAMALDLRATGSHHTNEGEHHADHLQGSALLTADESDTSTARGTPSARWVRPRPSSRSPSTRSYRPCRGTRQAGERRPTGVVEGRAPRPRQGRRHQHGEQTDELGAAQDHKDVPSPGQLSGDVVGASPQHGRQQCEQGSHGAGRYTPDVGDRSPSERGSQGVACRS